MSETAAWGFAFDLCADLYSDGSVLVDLRNYLSCTSNYYFGAWDLGKDEDGYNFLNVAVLFEGKTTDIKGETLEAKSTYTLNESATHTFNWTMNMNIYPGGNARTMDLTGSATAKYADFATFHTAVDDPLVKIEFDGAVKDTSGATTGTVKLIGLSNGVANAYYIVDYNGSSVRAGKWEGGKYSTVGASQTNPAGTEVDFDFTEVSAIGVKYSSAVTAGTGSVAATYGDIADFTAKLTTPQGESTVKVTLTKAEISVAKDGTPIAA
jgi:hypothetical protein